MTENRSSPSSLKNPEFQFRKSGAVGFPDTIPGTMTRKTVEGERGNETEERDGIRRDLQSQVTRSATFPPFEFRKAPAPAPFNRGAHSCGPNSWPARNINKEPEPRRPVVRKLFLRPPPRSPWRLGKKEPFLGYLNPYLCYWLSILRFLAHGLAPRKFHRIPWI